ncbi:MAG: HTH-type transcriptional regulator PgrR [Luteibacter sp.]|nr:MAG: HTH-type transcriptional regulator PgrR [Luteibacter sp.]
MLEEMAVFAQVVDSGSFSSAARQLGMTVPSVSRHVSRLEKHLGERLLLRNTRAHALTEIGREVYAACQALVGQAREVHAIADRFGAGPSGLLRVSAPIVFGETWLAPRLPGFLDACPDVRLHVSLVDGMVDLIDEGVDVALRISLVPDAGLASRPLLRVGYVLVASPDYLRRHGSPSTPSDLCAHRCIYLGYGRFGPHWRFTRDGVTEDVDIRHVASINNSAAILGMVEAHGGIGLVPDFTARAALAQERVTHVLADWRIDAPYTGTVHAAYTPGRHLALKVRAFIDYLVACIADDATDAPP